MHHRRPHAPESSFSTRTCRFRWVRPGAAALVLGASACAPGPARAEATATPYCDFAAAIGDAAQAQASGDGAAAERAARRALAATPRGAASARAEAALGLALAAEGRAADAVAPLAVGAAAAAGPARAALERARGEALLAAGAPADAARVLAEVAASGGDLALARDAGWRADGARLAAGDAAGAAADLEARLRAEPSAPQAAQARLALAAALRASGDAARALALYRSIWLDDPRSPQAAAAGDALARWRDAGGPVPAASGDDRLARAERLLATGEPAAAIAELGAPADPPPEPERAGALRALALVNQLRHADAAAVAAPLAASAAPEVRRTAELVLARAAARDGRLEEASALYRRVAAEKAPVPGLPEWQQRDLSDEAAFLAAWLYYDAGDDARAARLLSAFARAHPRSHRADDARWFAAWSLWRLGRAAAADRVLARLERGPLADRARYWRARLARDPGRRRALDAAVAAAEPYGWYGILARARLAAEGGRPPAPPPSPPPSALAPLGDGPAPDRLRAASELLALGLRDDALAELSDLAHGGRIRPVAAQAAELAAFAGDVELPFRMARDHLLPTRRALRWGHPDAHGALVRRGQALGVDPALLLAVMRRESSFRPAARSAAGAEGLLQLVPRTVTRLAAAAGTPDGLAERLADPEVSVASGAWYLGLLLSRFADPASAVAAYNAGPRPVAAWTRTALPLDAWVESIPWRETRQYVKIVLADWATYRALAGEPPPPLSPSAKVPPAGDGVAF